MVSSLDGYGDTAEYCAVTVFVRGLLFSDDGMSWNLRSALLLLCSDLQHM